jgi:hypothetical protein
MATVQTFTDSEGRVWDFNDANLIGSSYPSRVGQGVVNGTADAYDGGRHGGGIALVPGVHATISADGFCRMLESFTNVSDSVQTITVEWLSDVGSDTEPEAG